MMPLPPDVAAQQKPAVMQGAAGAQAGGGSNGFAMPPQDDLVVQFEGKLKELETLTNDMMTLLQRINPAIMALLVPIAQAGKALQEQMADVKARNGEEPPQPVPGAEPSPRAMAA